MMKGDMESCDAKRLHREQSIVDYDIDEDGVPQRVDVIVVYGGRKRAHRKELTQEDYELPPSNGGYGFKTIGIIEVEGIVWMVCQRTGSPQNWWVREIDWCEGNH